MAAEGSEDLAPLAPKRPRLASNDSILSAEPENFPHKDAVSSNRNINRGTSSFESSGNLEITRPSSSDDSGTHSKPAGDQLHGTPDPPVESTQREPASFLDDLHDDNEKGPAEVTDLTMPSTSAQMTRRETLRLEVEQKNITPENTTFTDGENVAEDDDIDSDLDLGLGDLGPEPVTPGPMGWLHHQMLMGVDPRNILARILPGDVSLPDDMSNMEMWSLIANYFQAFAEPRRKKLDHVNTIDDAISLLKKCNNVIVLSGAGVSVSCGIPDFRSRDGIYARLAIDFPDLPDPQAMFDIHYFRKDPRPFFKFAKEIYPGQYQPSICHKFISLLEQHNKLLRNYSQNIDTLEQVSGITRVVQCHGSFATATCTHCGHKVDAEVIRKEIFDQVIPKCPQCQPALDVQAILKPDIVFFGEGLPNIFYDCLDDDKDAADLLIVIGSSLKVRPVATIPYPSVIPNSVPQILINREPLPHMNFDIELLGDGDVIINEICHRLGSGWDHICNSSERLQEITEIPKRRDSRESGKSVNVEGMDNSTGNPLQSVSKEENKLSQSSDFEYASTPPSLESCADKAMFPKLGKERKEEEKGVECENKGLQEVEHSPEVEKSIEETRDSQSMTQNDIQRAVVDGSSENIVNTFSEVENFSKPILDKLSDTGVSSSDSHLNKESFVSSQGLEKSNEEGPSSELSRGVSNLSSNNSGNISQESGKERSVEGTSSIGKSETEPKHHPRRQSITEHMEASTFLFIPPNRYVFHGAEVYPEDWSDEEGNKTPGSPHGESEDGKQEQTMSDHAWHENSTNLGGSYHNSADNRVLSPDSGTEYSRGWGMHQEIDEITDVSSNCDNHTAMNGSQNKCLPAVSQSSEMEVGTTSSDVNQSGPPRNEIKDGPGVMSS
ncbi:NAD-dependent protein deacetylase sirtuin-1 [Holothuria leucospilota]|uniref:protein acetyllysine N-acetyltransferase n=1 Tax=Holothuria leucospilota TaxID=206669 RepID=A0A9Q0YHX7_HOLLE|nr:NAD-dependent protein deacetylase sirtuin-1 [Holothuria leucospilota]